MDLDGVLVMANINGFGPKKCLVRKCMGRYYLLHNYPRRNGDCPGDGNRMGYSHSWSFSYNMIGNEFDCDSGVEILRVLSGTRGINVTWDGIKSNKL